MDSCQVSEASQYHLCSTHLNLIFSNVKQDILRCHLSDVPQVCNVTQVEGGQSVKFSTEVLFSPEKFEIV